ncbi:hypothetical protein EXIGLDRAFT_847955 [Exidia glandulosa HHB12029]|uniref:F-box domain-containing protein n=1 Tax=Exidia glandulosa HHB12029 TaxID=1314781 RepID=A0A166MAG2_EXIGL|nr:hypothetical protein EXIGLDRAFT_847955 [Exidia glandulosa HHB12029]
MSTPTFPQEIVDIIIDCAWDLQPEFKHWRVNAGAHRVDGQEPFNVFALVSRSWVARARHCAFRDLIFRRKWSFDSRQFGIAFLENPLCTIREHVLRLDFEPAGSRPWGHNLADISYLRSFRNLKSLSLHGLVFEARSWPVESSIFESVLLAILENLDLEDCTFPNVDCLIQLIACATGLRSLRCSVIFLPDGGDKARRVVQSIPQHLTEFSITVEYDPCQKVLEWIYSASMPPRIESLELQAISDESVPIVSGALHVLGPSVVTLSLLLRSYEHDQNPFATAADLSTLRNLQHLVTVCCFLSYGRMDVATHHVSYPRRGY